MKLKKAELDDEPEEHAKRIYIRKSLGNSSKLTPDVEAISAAFEKKTNRVFNEFMD